MIRLNKAAIVEEAALDQKEQNYTPKLPSDKDLDQKVEKDLGKDDAAADIGVDLP